MNGKFYVYEHWRPDRGECFYVGKGFGNRAHDMRQRNRWHKFIQSKLSSLGTAIEIKIIAEGLSEEEAFSKEIERISFWKNDGADLVNITTGGDGVSGLRHTDEWKSSHTERMRNLMSDPNHRKKISTKLKGIKRTEEQKKNYCGPKSSEHIEAMKLAAKGRKRPGPHTDEHKRKQSETLKRVMKDSWARRKAAQLQE